MVKPDDDPAGNKGGRGQTPTAAAPKEDVRKKVVSFRLTESEYDTFMECAKFFHDSGNIPQANVVSFTRYAMAYLYTHFIDAKKYFEKRQEMMKRALLMEQLKDPIIAPPTMDMQKVVKELEKMNAQLDDLDNRQGSSPS